MSFIRDDKEIISDINVTPLVDVMLVLLIIFMISAPLMFNGVKLDLPKTKKVSSLQLSDDQIILSLTKDGSVFLGADLINLNSLKITLEKRISLTKNKIIFFRAESDVNYGRVAKMLANLRKDGFDQISLVTEIENK